LAITCDYNLVTFFDADDCGAVPAWEFFARHIFLLERID
jgi:hypothetical protein